MSGSPLERFLAKVMRDGFTSCWHWIGGKSSKGYGSFSANRVLVSSHRFAYQQWVGPIPDGLQLDHLCRNRGCCNPSHLEPVTAKTNTHRGQAPSGVNARKTHCKRGHALVDGNLVMWEKLRGRRRCLVCTKQRPPRGNLEDLK